jgi:hypothetical protein
MRYWLDTDLISIGIVAEDGREFYAESSEVDWSMASSWVLEFVGPKPEFWGYYADYDWVAFCWPRHCLDLKQMAGDRRITVPKPQIAHNAIMDARWNFEAWRELR